MTDYIYKHDKSVYRKTEPEDMSKEQLATLIRDWVETGSNKADIIDSDYNKKYKWLTNTILLYKRIRVSNMEDGLEFLWKNLMRMSKEDLKKIFTEVMFDREV